MKLIVNRDQKRIDELESVLRTLAGCLPKLIYVYGAYGERWSDSVPKGVDEYEEIDLDAILGERS